MNEKAILYDATKCTACRGCQVACKQWNELKSEVTTNRGTYENPPDLSPDTWLTIKFNEEFTNGTHRWLFTRYSCMHCTDAACINVCPSGALHHNEHGFVVYDKDKCIGCGYCGQYCPFDVPRLNAGRITGVGKIDKCTLCTAPGLDRLSTVEEPACVKTCPTGALIYGDRDELVAEGKSRVATLIDSNPNTYSQASLYGEKELSGLHVLYVLADSPKTYGLPEEPQFPVTATIQRDIFQPLTWAIWSVAGVGLALNALIARARQIQKKEVD